MALRAVPNLMDLRPGDPAEVVEAWKVAIERDDGPAFLALTRQKVPALDRTTFAPAGGLRRGGYVLAEASGGAPELILIASGSELHVAVDARERLEGEGVPTRVVSLPSWHLFSRQSSEYREEVLPPAVEARISVEAGATLGWERWIGLRGVAVGLDDFGASAPSEVLFQELGLTADEVVQRARALVRGTAAGATA